MGYHAIEIIKTIQQLSILKKLIFIIPMNKNQLTLGHKNDLLSGETAIDKYISLGTFFVLKWNYIGLLKSVGCPEEYCEIIDNILKSLHQPLSIRSLENCLNNFPLVEAFKGNKYKGLSALKQIWNSEKIDELVNKDIYYFFEIKNKLNEKYESNTFWNELLQLKQLINTIKSINPNLRNINLDNIINYPNKSNHIFFENILNDWKNYCNYLKIEIPKIKKAIENTTRFIEESEYYIENWKIDFFYYLNRNVDLKTITKNISHFINNSVDYFYETHNVNSTIVDLAQNLVSNNEEVTQEKLMQKLRQMYPNLLEVN